MQNDRCQLFPKMIHFIYKDKKYPIDIDLLNRYSEYFLSQKDNSTQGDCLELSFYDDLQDFSEESIGLFVNFFQEGSIKVTQKAAISLNFLSNKFKVPRLIEITDSFIETHHNNLVNSYLSKFNEKTIKINFYYEKIISKHLIEFIANDRLLQIPLSSLHRIIANYSKENSMIPTEVQIKIIDDFFAQICRKSWT